MKLRQSARSTHACLLSFVVSLLIFGAPLRAAEPPKPAVGNDPLVARLRALAPHANDFGPAYAPLYRAALPWYETCGTNPPHAVDDWMVAPATYAAELADALEHGRNYFADNPRALLPLVFDAPATVGGRRTNYWLILPANFGEAGRTFPLIINLHGSGWLGHKISFVRAARKGGTGGATFEVTPINEGGPWQIDYLNAYLDELGRILPIDADRIYVQGHSLGAMATWEWALNNPERFAAISPQAGIGQPYRAARLRDLPAWVIHGSNDDAVPTGFSDQMVTALQNIGGRVRYSRLAGVGHNMPADLNNAEIVAWFLRQTRNHTPPPPDPLAHLEFDGLGCSPRDILNVPATRYWHSEPMDAAKVDAMLRAARALFQKATDAGLLVDAPVQLRVDPKANAAALWLAVPVPLTATPALDADATTLPATRYVRFYFRGRTANALAQLPRIATEVAAQGQLVTDAAWITPLSLPPESDRSLAEFRFELR